MTALAASIGTGNVAGVATAIISGGPGALFWIWCYGLVAMAIKLTEAVLGRQFRVSSADGLSTGPMYYLRDGLKSPTLAWIYALVAGVAALTTTPFTQPNSIADVLRAQVGIPTIVSGIVLAVLTWLVIIGGLTPIGRVAERLSPLKVGLYLAGGLVVIVTYGARLPEVLSLVVTEAFSTRAVAGGVGRRRDAGRAALRPGARHLRQRSGLRHGGRRLRHGGEPRAGAAGAARRARGVHRLVRHVDDQRAGAAADRGLAVGRARRGRRGPRVRRGDARRSAAGWSRSACSCSATRR